MTVTVPDQTDENAPAVEKIVRKIKKSNDKIMTYKTLFKKGGICHETN